MGSDENHRPAMRRNCVVTVGTEEDTAIPVTVGGAMRYAYPQRLVIGDDEPLRLFGRAQTAHRGRLRILGDDSVIASRSISTLPERRLAITIAPRDLAGRSAVSILLD